MTNEQIEAGFDACYPEATPDTRALDLAFFKGGVRWLEGVEHQEAQPPAEQQEGHLTQAGEKDRSS